MSTRVVTVILAGAVAAATLAVGAGVASAKPAAPAGKVVPIVMADPGCHWFLVSGKKLAKLTVKGKATFRNLDEAALTFAGKGFYTKVPVGKTITLATPGVYKIKMVGQYKHDNILLLTIK